MSLVQCSEDQNVFYHVLPDIYKKCVLNENMKMSFNDLSPVLLLFVGGSGV